jgi:hypothetical protein
MDVRLAPAEHYDIGMEIVERVAANDEPDSAYLEAIAHFLAGWLRHQMSSTAN